MSHRRLRGWPGTTGLRPDGRQCWVCGQTGRADPPATANFCCDRCDVRWHAGTAHPRFGDTAFRQREFSLRNAGRLARARVGGNGARDEGDGSSGPPDGGRPGVQVGGLGELVTAVGPPFGDRDNSGRDQGQPAE